MNKEEMLKVIYENIADKTLSFGCRVVHNDEICKIIRSTGITNSPYVIEYEGGELGISDFDIIGHPVMIGDVLDFKEKDTKHLGISLEEESKILRLWQKKRLPIDEQSDECIDFIYDLCK